MATTEGQSRQARSKALERVDKDKGLGQLNQRLVGYIQQWPGACTAAALIGGFLVGRLVRR